MNPQQYQNNMNIPGQPVAGGVAIPGSPVSGAAATGAPVLAGAAPVFGQPVVAGAATPTTAGQFGTTSASGAFGAAPMQQPAVAQTPVVAPAAAQVIMPQGTQANANAAGIGSAAIAANQASPVSPNKDVPTSTQATLQISELRDNVAIMKDGSFRAVIACKSINFDLMSDAEREGVEYSYQNFLNSLKFTVQILVRSQRVDIGPYIERLSEIRRNNDNMLLGVLMDDYINFIDILSQEANIMDKSFFIVVPYYTSVDAEKLIEQTRSIFKVFSKNKGAGVTRIDRETYNKALSELTNRVDSVMSGLYQIGVHSVRLNTKELAELYYNFNNPDTAVREPLVDFSKLATMYVRKGEQNG